MELFGRLFSLCGLYATNLGRRPLIRVAWSSLSGECFATGFATASATFTRQPCRPALPNETVSVTESYPRCHLIICSRWLDDEDQPAQGRAGALGLAG